MGKLLFGIAVWLVLIFLFIVPRWDPDRIPTRLFIRRLVQMHLVLLAIGASAVLMFWLRFGW